MRAQQGSTAAWTMRSEWPDQHSADLRLPGSWKGAAQSRRPKPMGAMRRPQPIGEGGRPSERPPEKGRFMTCVPAHRTRGGVRRARRPTSCLRRGAH